MHNETAFSQVQPHTPAPLPLDLFRRGFEYLRDRWPLGHTLPVQDNFLQTAAGQSKAPPWHIEAIVRRNWRRHVSIPCGWIARHLPRQAAIFEPGCGSGANLLWLASRGFTHLNGSDIDETVLEFSDRLQTHLGHSLNIWQDNALAPSRLPKNQGAILSVNWLYHLPGASQDSFFDIYKGCLSPEGVFVFDAVSHKYNTVANNQYHTDDWGMPEDQRRPSEYTFRLSHQDVADLARRHGFSVLRQTMTHSRPQRCVYMLGRARQN
ncbi:MAG: class I SAM-dependent methyltransferase [Desulfovibrio sp.]|nr:class I SAM-dependent methyltransferase [Desulfovibrio sp.]